ncbi:MAG: CPBP family intramembrane glutamic endopeptidase [Actinomycetota bacterium]
MSSPVVAAPASDPSTTATASAGLAYHRLARLRPRYRWWRMLLTGLLGFAMYVAMLLLIVVPVGIIAAIDPVVQTAVNDLFFTMDYFDLDRPWLFLALVIPLILMIPALLLASRIVEGRGVGLLSSVVGRLRMGWLWRTLVLALAVFAVYFAVVFGFAALSGEHLAPSFDHPGLWLMVALVVLLIPLQAAAEEYVFRGYLMQLIGGWLRHPAFAILLPVPLFVLGHDYDVWGAASVGIFAIVAAWITWRTGGLEAAISLHIVNNVLIFLLGAVDLVDANASSGDPLDLVASTLTMVAFALIVDRWARRRGIERYASGASLPVRRSVSAEGTHRLGRAFGG